MMRLLRVELRRLVARRSIRLLMAGAVAIVAITAGNIAWNSQPPTEQERAEAERMVEEELRWQEEALAECEEAPEEWELESADECADQFAFTPTVDDFLYNSIFSFADEITEVMTGLGAMLLLVSFVIGVSFIGAEWSSGMMGTHLTWEPRRGRVLAAKTVAATVVAAVFAAVVLALAVVALYWVASTWGTTDRTTGEVIADLAWRELRTTGLAAAAAAIGVGIAGLLRSTVGALVAAAAYLGVVEGLIRSAWQGSDRWLLSHNALAWLDDGFVVSRWTCPRFGGECTEAFTEISLAGGATVLAATVGVVIALHTGSFYRRDVV